MPHSTELSPAAAASGLRTNAKFEVEQRNTRCCTRSPDGRAELVLVVEHSVARTAPLAHPLGPMPWCIRNTLPADSGDIELSFRVPNERDNANTVSLPAFFPYRSGPARDTRTRIDPTNVEGRCDRVRIVIPGSRMGKSLHSTVMHAHKVTRSSPTETPGQSSVNG
jgi:hypothetical protein